MQTPSHFIMSAALQYPLRRFNIPINLSGLLIGAVLPDMALLVLSIIYWYFYVEIEASYTKETIWEHLHELYFTDPIWITGHNFFHSLVIGGLLLMLGWWLVQRRQQTFLFWLAASAMLHTTIDIFTHTSDGPLFLFPLNWTYRFASPVSYWESGSWFMMLEYALNALLLLFIGRNWLISRQSNKQQSATTTVNTTT